MGQPLTGTEVQATYEALLKTPNNTVLVTGNVEPITDGAGNESALQLGVDQVKLSGEFVNIEHPNGTSGIMIDTNNVGLPADLNYYGTHDFSNATVTGIGGGSGGGLVAGDGGSSMMSDGSLTPFAPAEADGTASIALGLGAKANRDSSIAIGTYAVAGTDSSIAIGQVNNTFLNAGQPYVAIIPSGGIDMAFRDNSVAIGPSCYPAQSGVAIGIDAQHNGGGHYRSVIVGNTLRAAGDNDVVIGYNSNAYNADSPDKITIGANNNNYAEKSIIIGSGNDNADSVRVKAIIIGNSVKGAQNSIVIGNDSPSYAAADAIQIGNGGLRTLSNYSINIGYANEITSGHTNNIIIGQNIILGGTPGQYVGAAAIGDAVVIKAANTLHTRGLNVGDVSEYADNAAAVSAGLPIGQVYRTGDLLKIVHA